MTEVWADRERPTVSYRADLPFSAAGEGARFSHLAAAAARPGLRRRENRLHGLLCCRWKLSGSLLVNKSSGRLEWR